MDESQLLAEAVARAWIDSTSFTPTEADQLGPDLLRALRRLESAQATETESSRSEILALLQLFPSFEKRVRGEINALRSEAESGSAKPAFDVAYRAKHYRHSLLEIAYATDRRVTEKPDIRDWYGGGRGELALGIVRVSIPDDNRMGRLDTARMWPLRFREDRKRHLEVADLAPSDWEQHISSVAELLHRAPEPEILVFIHGYNVSFADAARRTAQIAYDIDFKGVPFLYSWPSDAATLSYLVDGENAQWSQHNFSVFLQLALTSFDCRRVHVIAHSMGNRILSETLAALDTAALPGNAARLGQIVFAAPDIDSGVFAHRARKFVGKADRYTLYVSDKDQALNMSQRFARHPRAGQAGTSIVVLDGIDTIDASDLDTGLMSHSYVGTHRSLISDLYYLINRNDLPGERFGLRPVTTPAGTYWAFRR